MHKQVHVFVEDLDSYSPEERASTNKVKTALKCALKFGIADCQIGGSNAKVWRLRSRPDGWLTDERDFFLKMRVLNRIRSPSRLA
jgi:hypothetical protein